MSADPSPAYWIPGDLPLSPKYVCLGTGRFLRSVLVPLFEDAPPVLIQTRGRSFVDHVRNSNHYPVDTVLPDGSVRTDHFSISGAFSLGHDKAAFYQHVNFGAVQILGVGVTEQGLSSHETQAMKDLYELLTHITSSKVCVINTDNVPNNGDVLRSHMLALADGTLKNKIHNRQVVFLNTMVDRITSHRTDDVNVPRAEPLPSKALVVADPHNELPPNFTKHQQGALGLVVRGSQEELNVDINLKLRIANGTHTALAQVMALCGLLTTDRLNDNPIFLEYVDAFVKHQVIPAALTLTNQHDVDSVWMDWRKRLTHASFGLSCLFITQGAAAKGGIRFGNTVKNAVQYKQPICVATVFAYASLLRFLTPCSGITPVGDVYTGWMNGASSSIETKSGGTEYADGLRYNLEQGWYEFRCACKVNGRSISEHLGKVSGVPQQPSAYETVIRLYLIANDGGDLAEIQDTESFRNLVSSIATLYARMVAGDDLVEMLLEIKTKGFADDAKEFMDCCNIKNGRPLHFRPCPVPDSSNLMNLTVTEETVNSVVVSEVASVRVVDLHTHLLPPSHGPLCLWGIDELLTYHYLVAEYFITAPPSISPEAFFAMTKQDQADLVWKALFVDRIPVSEAARGVVTTLMALGLSKAVDDRDLESIREFYRGFRDEGVKGTGRFSDLVHKLSGVRYNIMTNIPFDPNETQYWRPSVKAYPRQYRSALRVDPLLSGDRETVEKSLKASGYETTLEGARQFVRDWIDTMLPEYLMASTPHNFVLRDGEEGLNSRVSVNVEAMKQPGAFAAISSGVPTCGETDEELPSIIDEESDLLTEVLMKVCEERDLPLALKIGAHRAVNPRLKMAGDGLAFADAGMLGRLCARFPKVRFLATFLSRNNQHEACVLASKFSNLHIYGCWWYCFTPSIMKEITQMRLEMLGFAFTAQHSDARVLDQLIYKWSHSRAVIAEVVADELCKLIVTGYKPTRTEIRRDICRILGGSYEEFIAKSFLPVDQRAPRRTK